MPYRINGFGTAYYGKRDRAEDGSYITTQWVTALWVPIVPLGSYRVLPIGKRNQESLPPRTIDEQDGIGSHRRATKIDTDR